MSRHRSKALVFLILKPGLFHPLAIIAHSLFPNGYSHKHTFLAQVGELSLNIDWVGVSTFSQTGPRPYHALINCPFDYSTWDVAKNLSEDFVSVAWPHLKYDP